MARGRLATRKVLDVPQASRDMRTQSRDTRMVLRPAPDLQIKTTAKTVPSRNDFAEHLRTPEEMVAHLEASIEEAAGDTALISNALGDIARATGMSGVSCDAGLSRDDYIGQLH